MESNLMGKIGEVVFSTGLNVLAACYSYQPRKIQLILGNLLGSFLHLIRFRLSVVRQNLKSMGAYKPQLIVQEASLLKASYRHLGCLCLEILMLFGPKNTMKKFLLKYSEVQGAEQANAALRQGKGIIFLSSHCGNWEVMAGSGGVLGKWDIMIVTKKLKPDWLHAQIESGRADCGVQGTYEPKTLKDVLKHLKNNKPVGFVIDQYSGPPVGVRVPFFGVPVGTALAVAAIAKRTGAAVLPVENYRMPDGNWIVSIRPPLEWKDHADSAYELAMNTANYTKEIEDIILAHPEQWLWTHRRFKGDLSPLREGEWFEGRARS